MIRKQYRRTEVSDPLEYSRGAAIIMPPAILPKLCHELMTNHNIRDSGGFRECSKIFILKDMTLQ